MSLFSTSLSVPAFGLALSVSMAQATPPMPALCDPMQSHLCVSNPEDLGNGLVARMETFFGDGDTSSNWTVVTQCASGLTIAVPVEEWPEAQAVKA